VTESQIRPLNGKSRQPPSLVLIGLLLPTWSHVLEYSVWVSR